MGLSRLDNFLKNVRGNIIYVNPNDLDATDSIENQGNSLARPFITIQRALIEAARFSYQRGLDNDRFGKTTILLSPGEHFVDNRPGWIPIHDETPDTFLLRDGSTSQDFPAFSSSSNFSLDAVNNMLYKLNSIHGGVIVPRGVSIVASDLRKTKVRPKYVPNPENANIERSAVFRVTGGCYFFQFSILDGDPNGVVYKDYTTANFTPTFSHHKLTCFEYADGVNNVSINDTFNTDKNFDRTDLDMYYEKIGLAYGPASGRTVEPDYPSSSIDIQSKIDEYRIVGPLSGQVGVSSIFAGDSATATNTVTVQLDSGLSGLNVDTKIIVNDVADSAYNGSFVVSTVETVDVDGNTTRFTYKSESVPTSVSLTPASAFVTLDTDTVESASPYVFNISLRSVYGMCGMHADGSKATGFKSMVVAQFTGVSLQKDDKAFVRYNKTDGDFDNYTSIDNIHSDGLAKYHPDYYNYHIKASNNSVIQLVSIFAIGYSQHFLTESGGDFSVTNSNSNFGQLALASNGYRNTAFAKDDVGYITNVIPPKSLSKSTINLEYGAIDVANTVDASTTSRLYLYQEENLAKPPKSIIQGYRIGAKVNDNLNVVISESGTPITRQARIVMPNTAGTSNEVSSVKISNVGRNVSTGNSITSSTITFTSDHSFIEGETIRVISEDARLPDGLDENRVYFAITTGVNSDQIKIAPTLTDALSNNSLTFNKLGGELTVESRVSDKISGDVGHPVQFDTSRNQWYVNVSSASTENDIYSTINTLGVSGIGAATPRTFINRLPDSRSNEDRIYKMRYVIPASSANSAGISSARPPRDSYVFVESNDVTGSDDTEVALQFNPSSVSMDNEAEVRNFRFIKTASHSSGNSTFTTELPHNLSVGSQVLIENVTSTNNTTGVANSAYNGTFTVSSISSSKEFVVSGPASNPGTYTNNNNLRTTSLPTFKRSRQNKSYYVYNTEQLKEYITGEQTGIYYLTVINASNAPVVSPFNASDSFKFSQPITNLFPQSDRDNPISNPTESRTYALADPLGKTVLDESRNSVTRETITQLYDDLGVGIGITDIISNSAGTAHTIFTNVDHGLQSITKLSLLSAGSGYGEGPISSTEQFYNATIGPSTTGDFATARVEVNSSNELTANIKIMSGGTGFQVGDRLSVTGTATTTGFSAGTVVVEAINNNIGDTIRISGITSLSTKAYNDLYRITGVTTTSTKEFQVSSASTISNPNIAGVSIGADVTSDAYFTLTGPTLSVSSLTYDNITGFATVKTSTPHGYSVDNSVRLGGADREFYNDTFVISEVVGLTTFIVDCGVRTDSPATTGTIRLFNPGPQESQAGNVDLNDESFGGRTVSLYGNASTTLLSAVADATTTSINVSNIADLNLQIGDYLRIEDEIVRVKSTSNISDSVTVSNPITVFRGLFGTKPTAHTENSPGDGIFPAVKKVIINPVEFRRPSIIRASGHTFEYIGYGPGNYSTSLPSKQGRQPTLTEQLISQKFNTNGGVSVYTGMNDRGDFYIGNKRITSTTGKEEVFDTPIPTVTGEDPLSTGIFAGSLDLVNHEEVNVSRKLKVTGGADNNILSEFDSPVVFTNKITSTSDEGVEANSLFLQGDATVSRKYTVGIATPTIAGNPGDVVYNNNPQEGGTLGWTYTVDNAWYPFGSISIDAEKRVTIFDKVGIATTTPGECVFKVGSGSTQFCVDALGVGIGTTANTSAKLNVLGTVVATAFTGDGSGLTNLENDSLFSGVVGSGKTGIAPNNNLNVGIGTTIVDRTADLTVGTAGIAQTALLVNNTSTFIGTAHFEQDLVIPSGSGSGILSATGYNLNSTSGSIVVGVATATTLVVGTAVSTSGSDVGFGTDSPRAKVDVVGESRFEAYTEKSISVTSSSGVVDLDLSKGQSFELTTTEDVSVFNLLNITSGTTRSYTIKISQDSSTAYNVGIDTYRLDGGGNKSCNWPGGVIPVVTVSAGATDLYSFMTFDGGDNVFGVVGGQNFS